MSKMGKNETARYEGAAWYDRLIDRVGIEEAKKELAWRGAAGAPLQIEKSEIHRYEHDIRQACTKTICCMAVITLMDEFDFDPPQLNAFIKRFNLKTDALENDYVSWPDLAETIFEETGINVDEDKSFKTGEAEWQKWRRKQKYEGHNY